MFSGGRREDRLSLPASATPADWYEKRNAIAHGRKGVKMTLGEYVDVDAFVAQRMVQIASECADKLKIIL
jgi:hypothetical protein